MKKHSGAIWILAVFLGLTALVSVPENAVNTAAKQLSAGSGEEKENDNTIMRYTLAHKFIGGHKYSAKISSKQNPAVIGYVSNGGLDADMKRYFRFYETAMENADPARVEIRIHLIADWKDNVGGQVNTLDFGTHIMIGKNTSLAAFKSALFHELGHFIFIRYEKEYSPTIHNFWTLYAKYQRGRESGADSGDFQKLENEIGVLADAYKKSALHLHELFADCVSAAVTKNPAIANFRNLAENDSDPFKYSSSNMLFLHQEHAIMDPMRGHIWQNHIKKSLNNDHALSRILAKLLNVLSIDACQRYPGYKKDPDAAKRTTSYTDNVRLINEFEKSL